MSKLNVSWDELSRKAIEVLDERDELREKVKSLETELTYYRDQIRVLNLQIHRLQRYNED